jgi:hypothetical protein
VDQTEETSLTLQHIDRSDLENGSAGLEVSQPVIPDTVCTAGVTNECLLYILITLMTPQSRVMVSNTTPKFRRFKLGGALKFLSSLHFGNTCCYISVKRLSHSRTLFKM